MIQDVGFVVIGLALGVILRSVYLKVRLVLLDRRIRRLIRRVLAEAAAEARPPTAN